MSWNYRVFRRTGLGDDVAYFIHEVYDLAPLEPGRPAVSWDEMASGTAEADDDEGSSPDGLIDTMSLNEIAPSGETLDELRQDLEAMLEALDKPVLEYDGYLGKPMA